MNTKADIVMRYSNIINFYNKVIYQKQLFYRSDDKEKLRGFRNKLLI